MLDRYLDMVLAGEADRTNGSASEREEKKAVRKDEPSYRRVQEQCEAEVTRREYRCAMKALTPETWQSCID